MILDALKFLTELGAKAAGSGGKAHILEHPTDRTLRYLVTPEETTLLDPTPPDRNHRLYSIVDFAPLIQRLGKSHFSAAEGITEEIVASVWVWGNLAKEGRATAKVIAILDDQPDSLRADRATCQIETTDEFELVRSLVGKNLDQRAMRELLRVQLADCDVPKALIEWVSKIDWTNDRKTQSELRSGRESLGADIKLAAVSTAAEMPEEVRLMVRVFNEPTQLERSPIVCAFSADPKTQTLSLQPRGNVLQLAYDEALGSIRAELVDRLGDAFPVYMGLP